MHMRLSCRALDLPAKARYIILVTSAARSGLLLPGSIVPGLLFPKNSLDTEEGFL